MKKKPLKFAKVEWHMPLAADLWEGQLAVMIAGETFYMFMETPLFKDKKVLADAKKRCLESSKKIFRERFIELRNALNELDL